MRIIGVLTEDDYLFRKTELILEGKAEVRRVTEPRDARECEAVLFDGTEPPREEFPAPVRTMSYSEGADIRLPLPISGLEELLFPTASAILFHKGSRTVTVNNNTVRLTEIEHALLLLLARGGGEFVSREEISESVWGGRADSGLINLYVHYLREKLETGDERIILSSRKNGYKIDEKYLGGELYADAD